MPLLRRQRVDVDQNQHRPALDGLPKLGRRTHHHRFTALLVDNVGDAGSEDQIGDQGDDRGPIRFRRRWGWWLDDGYFTHGDECTLAWALRQESETTNSVPFGQFPELVVSLEYQKY